MPVAAQAANFEWPPLLDQPPGPSFELFPNLPPEIALIIWQYALAPFTSIPHSRLFHLSTYSSHPFPSFRPLIRTPPAYKWFSPSELAILAQRQLENPQPPREIRTIYVKLGRTEKWRGFFKILHACKLARQLGLEEWLQGLKMKYEGCAMEEVYDIYLMRDLVEVLESLLVRVKR